MDESSSVFSYTEVAEEVHTGKIKPANFRLRAVEDLHELQLSIRENGLIYPLIVRPLGERFEIVVGNRRLQACKNLKFRKVPCMIVDLDDKEAFEISLIENVQREALSPLEEAHSFKRYAQQHGWGGISNLAKRIGKSASYVSRRIKLLSLPVELQQELLRQRKSSSIMSELLAIKDDKLEKEVSRFVLANGLSEKDTRALVNSVKRGFNSDASIQRSVVRSSDTNSNAKSEERVLRKLITVLKIALVRSGDIISESNELIDLDFKKIMMEKRYALHQLVDSLILMQKKIHGMQRKNNAG